MNNERYIDHRQRLSLLETYSSRVIYCRQTDFHKEQTKMERHDPFSVRFKTADVNLIVDTFSFECRVEELLESLNPPTLRATVFDCRQVTTIIFWY